MSGNQPAIIVEQDLNTLVEECEHNSFDSNAVSVFFEMAAREADDILRKYFP